MNYYYVIERMVLILPSCLLTVHQLYEGRGIWHQGGVFHRVPADQIGSHCPSERGSVRDDSLAPRSPRGAAKSVRYV